MNGFARRSSGSLVGENQSMNASLHTIPARRGKAAHVRKGQQVRMINTHGTQVVDTWAFNAEDLHEFMSMEHTRPHIGHIMPKPGDIMYTNKRRPILTIVEDSSPGIHDTIIAACDRYRYKFLGVEGYHDNCTDNLHSAMAELGLTPPEVPSPFNVWMNIPVKANGDIAFLPINNTKPTEAHFQIV
jgi:uncharacterized protein